MKILRKLSDLYLLLLIISVMYIYTNISGNANADYIKSNKYPKGVPDINLEYIRRIDSMKLENFSIRKSEIESDYYQQLLSSSIESKEEQPNEVDLIHYIKIHESNNNPNLVNTNEQAVGILQIRPIVIRELKDLGYNYKLSDRYDPNKSAEIFDIYTQYWIEQMSYNDNDEIRARIWNGGPKGPHKKSTKSYWKSIKSLMENI